MSNLANRFIRRSKVPLQSSHASHAPAEGPTMRGHLEMPMVIAPSTRWTSFWLSVRAEDTSAGNTEQRRCHLLKSATVSSAWFASLFKPQG